MNYLDLINNFWIIDEFCQFSCCETRLYFYLLKIANRLGWENNWTHSDNKTCANVGVSKNAMKNARNRLIQANLISIKAGGNGAKDKTRYQILIPNHTPNHTPNYTPNHTPNLKKEVTQEKNNINKLNQTNPPFISPAGVNEPQKVLKNFICPTIQEISEYALTTNLIIDANRFFDFYTSKNWYIGKNKMKDWKAAARNWNRNDQEKQKTINQPFKQKSQQYEQF